MKNVKYFEHNSLPHVRAHARVCAQTHPPTNIDMGDHPFGVDKEKFHKSIETKAIHGYNGSILPSLLNLPCLSIPVAVEHKMEGDTALITCQLLSSDHCGNKTLHK